MRSHKYVKRTGGPGNYKYWYKMPDGSLQAGDQEEGRKEHAHRLVAGKVHGHHEMKVADIAKETGLTSGKVNSRLQNYKIAQRAATAPTHGFEEHHLKEAHTPISHPDYARHVAAAERAPAAGAPGPRRATPRATPAARRGSPVPASARTDTDSGARDPHGRTDAERTSDASRGRTARAARRLPHETDASLAARRTARTAPPVVGGVGSHAARPAAATPAAPATPAAETREAKIKRLRAELAALGGPSFERPEEAPAVVAASAERVRTALAPASRAASTRAPAAAALRAADPDFAAAEAPVRRAEEAATRGENPYLNGAKAIFEKIKGDLKPERKTTCEHVFAALTALGPSASESALVAKYKELSGKNIRGISGISDEFEKGTGHGLDEVLGNAPLDLEVERMKRGYAAKQMERMRPHLKDSFTAQNPSAPPPMPTFGDIKSWGEFGGAKPSWAGTTRLSMPKEVFDAAVKGGDGKPLYPPAWMPIHLMPAWNYVAKKVGADGYQARPVGFTQEGAPNVGSQASFQEGMITAALRKYVAHRGAGKMVDIPKAKLTEIGLTHAEIFKGEMDFKEIIKHKIVDLVALQPFLDAEMKVKKSFELVVDVNAPAVSFRKGFTVPLSKGDIVKARIEKIRGLINEKKQSRLS